MAGKKPAAPVSPPRRAPTAKSSSRALAGNTADARAAATRFPVVGIGASAGGLEALSELLKNLPADTGMAFVIVTHQLVGQASLLPELLGGVTAMPVAEVTDGVSVQPDHVYVSPPGGHLAIRHSRLYLMATPVMDVQRLPIDYFFRALSVDRQQHAICVVLSGTGSDGTLGLKAIKAEAGMAMAQQPLTAKYAGMPSSAIATGMVDFVLPIAAMPRQLKAYAAGPYLADRSALGRPEAPDLAEPLAKIFVMLQDHTGHDFSAYKLNTIRRRVERRMQVHQLANSADYLRYLQNSPQELDVLFRELLINVTRFFRDPQIYDAVLRTWLPGYLSGLAESRSLRIWVPGCSSGEEVFSLAIALHEYMESTNRTFGVQIFGTDIDADAVESARRGLYPQGIAADLTPARLERYFTPDDGGFRIVKEIRRMAIFAPQSLIRDPPFTRLDLVSCRNVLIYMNVELQQKLLATFAYALRPGGLLVLGTSETVGHADTIFETLDKKSKLFRRKAESLAVLPDVARTALARAAGVPDATPAPRDSKLLSLIERALLVRSCPASIVFNERGDIFHVQGRTGTLLEPAEGRPRMNVVEMAREGLRRPLAHALRQVATTGKDVLTEGIQVHGHDDGARMDMSVTRIQDPEALRGLLIATFRPSSAAMAVDATSTRRSRGRKPPDYVGDLERELQRATQALQSTVEELETANEELISANEESQSTNEEMLSSNEELETSQEELQSLNEELQAVNAELRQKLDLLGQASDDMQNLLDSTDIATVFLDRQLCIKRYTESAKGLINLIPGDIGRPIADLTSQLQYPAMSQDCRKVLETLAGVSAEVQARTGAWYRVRVLPYRTMDKTVNGLVLTFDNVDALKKAQRAAALSQAMFENVVNTVRDPLLVIDEDLRVVRANHAFYRLFSLEPAAVERVPIDRLAEAVWDVTRLHKLLADILPDNPGFEDYALDADFPLRGRSRLLLNARRLERAQGLPGMILLAMQDVTHRVAVPGAAP